MKRPKFSEVLEDAKRVNGTADAEDDITKIIAVLLASAIMGPDVAKLEKYTGCDREFLDGIDEKCRKNGIWVGNKVHANWFDEEEGTISLICDVLAAAGMTELARSIPGRRSAKVASPKA